MKLFFLRILVLAFACNAFAVAPSQAQAPQGTIQLAGSTTVPFKLSGNHIFVQATVDGKPFAFIFDTGGAASLSVAAQNALGLTVIGHAQLGGAGRDVTTVGLAAVPQFTVGGMTYSNGVFAYLPPIPLLSPFPGVPFGGIFGREIFRNMITTIDYQASQLTFTKPAGFTAPPGAQTLPLTMRRQVLPNVTASINGHSGSFDVDAGSGQALIVTKSFADSTGLESEFPKVVSMQVGRGVGGPVMGDAGRGRNFTLGSYQFTNLPVSVTSEGIFGNSELAGNIGAEILRRFTVTFDVPDSKLFLSPNANFPAPFDTNRAGMIVIPDGAGWKVDSVVTGGPAAQAGIQGGDVVLMVNGQATSALGTDGLHKIWFAPAGSVVQIQLQRGGKTIAANFILRDLF